jgi:hypothetical protein
MANKERFCERLKFALDLMYACSLTLDIKKNTLTIKGHNRKIAKKYSLQLIEE